MTTKHRQFFGRIRLVTILFLYLFLILVSAVAQTALGYKPVSIEGLSDCEEWLASRQNRTSIALELYVIGMLNGLVIGADREFWQAQGPAMTRNAAYFGIDNYCRTHPTDQLNAAVVTFFEERARK